MKVWRQKFLHMVHEKPVRGYFKRKKQYVIALRIDHGDKNADNHYKQETFGVLQKMLGIRLSMRDPGHEIPDHINTEQNNPHAIAPMQVHPKQRQEGQQDKSIFVTVLKL